MTGPWDHDSHIPLGEITWADDVPGIRAREQHVDGRRWAIVEYAQGAWREQWCRDGHLGFVLEGAIRYEFEDGGDVLTANEGEAFSLSTGRAHRGRNIADAPTRLFLIDDPERA
ncbi:MAG: cupin domain-containing protein [Solirubrobacterales bacterium]|nr:cupin domain-containing protein [Solirubrobacterales bacterium]MBV8946219.1 cupin domain-containing protein [Solirubrobacterales bacterium]MBV9365864.1 cupin domain-containing protein [Solirubrobacterales bacterium]MBV9809376.1 cupin domain-containing protein [Solirubrobacterales bacterium]